MVLGLPAKILGKAEGIFKRLLLFAHPRRHLVAQGSAIREAASKDDLLQRVHELENELADLRGNQERVQILAQIVPVGLFQTNAGGKCVYLNQRCGEIAGVDPAKIEGLGWDKYLHPEDQARVMKQWESSKDQGGVFKSEFRFQHHGKTLWVMAEAVQFSKSPGSFDGYIGALIDITARHNAESLLQQSERRLNMALQTGRIVAWEWKADTDTLIRTDNAPEVMGLDRTDKGFPSARFLEAVHPSYREELRRNLEKAFAGEKFLQNEFQLGKSDGSNLWISSQAEVIHGADGKLQSIVGVSRDVTLRHTVQESLENARRFLEQTLDALPSHVAILDEDGTIISVNSAWRRFAIQNGFVGKDYGLGLNYLHVCRAASGFGANDAKVVADALEQLLSQKRSEFYFEYSCDSADEKRWFVLRIGRFETDSSTRLFCSHHNVTELKRGEEALRQSEARFRQLADSMPQIVWSAQADGKIDYQNKKFFEQTGLSNQEAVAPDLWQKILHPDDAPVAVKKWMEAVETGLPFQMEYRYVDKKRGYRWHLGRALPVCNEKGKIIRWFGTCTDIEEQKQTVQVLQHAQKLVGEHAAHLEKAVGERTAQLEQSMKQMESFCYSIAHDLRAPLRAMQGFTTALCEDYSDAFDETGREYADRIIGSARRMERLIQDLLNYGRLSHIEVKLEPVELDATVNMTLGSLDREIKQRKARINIGTPFPLVKANRIMLEEILYNLVSNALKFVAPGKTPTIEIRGEVFGENLRVYVTDNGIGIEPEYQDRIFGVFEKINGSANEQATGIGLAIVRKSLERLGGRVGVESQPGRGSCFWFELPLCEAGSNTAI